MTIDCSPDTDNLPKDFFIKIFRETFTRQGDDLIPKSQGSFDFQSDNGKRYEVEFTKSNAEVIDISGVDLNIQGEVSDLLPPPAGAGGFVAESELNDNAIKTLLG